MTADPAAIATRGLTKRYRAVTALSEATITVPEGRISALIGPNGAGKTTLLKLLAGLARPTGGEVTVLGGTPRQDPAFLAGIGYLAQEIPLYRRFTAEDHIGIGAHLNPRWDATSVRQRLASLKIPPGQPVGTLSGGQRAQVALALTLAKLPRLLLLDEPVAALDPLARAAVPGHPGRRGRRRRADRRAVLASGRGHGTGLRPPHPAVGVPGPAVRDIGTVLAGHRVLAGPRKDTTALEKTHSVIHAVHTARQTTLFVRLNGPVADPAWEAADVGLEELVLAYMDQDTVPAYARLTTVGED
jgi:ABC-2 type transport system ATP-binding protein